MFKIRGAPVLGAPQNLQGRVEGRNVVLTWNPVANEATGALQHYVVESCDTACTDDSTVWTSVGTSTVVDGASTYSYTHSRGVVENGKNYRGTFPRARSWSRFRVRPLWARPPMEPV